MAEGELSTKEWSAEEGELLARVRSFRQEEPVPASARERLHARLSREARRGPGLPARARELVRVKRWSSRPGVWGASMMLGVVLLAGVGRLLGGLFQSGQQDAGLGGASLLEPNAFKAAARVLGAGEPLGSSSSLFGEVPFSPASSAYQVRRWDDLRREPGDAKAHELVSAGMCVTLRSSERILAGWPWVGKGAAAPKPVELRAGKPYRLAFKAWASEPWPSQILVGVGHSVLPFSASAGARVPVSSEPRVFVVDFVQGQGDPSVGVAFLAKAAGTGADTKLCVSHVELFEHSAP